MAEVKCPSCGASIDPQGAGACPFCGSPIGAPDTPSPDAVSPLENREERMAELMKQYGDAKARGDHEAAAGHMEEYLRTTVTGLSGFETKEKVESFVAESMKTFRQGMESTEPAAPSAEALDENGGTLLRKDSPTTERAGEEDKKSEESDKRGFAEKLRSLKGKVGGLVDVDEIIDDAKNVFGG